VELIRRIVSRRLGSAAAGRHPGRSEEADGASPPIHHMGDNCPARPRS